jgi:site-specific DNA-methyltransferase (adenine-specific)
MKPYYQDDMVTMYHANFRDVFEDLVALEADAVVTDPPYGETSLEWDRWVRFWPVDATQLAPTMWCFGSMRMFLTHAQEFNAWKYAQEVVWEKHNGSSLAADRFSRVHEFATHWYQGAWADVYNVPPTTPDAMRKVVRKKAKPAHHQGAAGPSYFVSEDGGDRLMRSVIKLRSMHGRAINETEKPVQLVSTLLRCSVPPGGLVLDIFAGSGSTGIAARQLGMRAVLVEMRESQCEKTARRLQTQTEQPLDFGEAS